MMLTPAILDIDIKIIADKDVPAGILYKLVEESDLPPFETMMAWEMDINENNSDGIGLTRDDFYKKYPECHGWAVL